MDLFDTAPAPIRNLLPKDGPVLYYSSILDDEKTDYYLHALMQNIEWRYDVLLIFDRKITTKRKVAWCSDQSNMRSIETISKSFVYCSDKVRFGG